MQKTGIHLVSLCGCTRQILWCNGDLNVNFGLSKMKVLILLKEVGVGREEIVETLEAV